jgi:methylenetetrahydrofolate reductase (NADPH)
MGRISLELVPRDELSFAEELTVVRERFLSIDTLNIPDILKFDMRIPEACKVASRYFKDVIPHIRAVSVSRREELPCRELFDEQGIKEILVILGDNPDIVSKSSDPEDSISLIRK